jgi:hypothetical protein
MLCIANNFPLIIDNYVPAHLLVACSSSERHCIRVMYAVRAVYQIAKDSATQRNDDHTNFHLPLPHYSLAPSVQPVWFSILRYRQNALIISKQQAAPSLGTVSMMVFHTSAIRSLCALTFQAPDGLVAAL